MQLYNIRVWLASRAESGSSAHEMAEPSQARSATELHRAELGSTRFQPYSYPWTGTIPHSYTSRKRLNARGTIYFYRRIRLSTDCAIFSGGFLRKPPLKSYFYRRFLKKTACKNP
jgi:hypothetical protein